MRLSPISVLTALMLTAPLHAQSANETLSAARTGMSASCSASAKEKAAGNLSDAQIKAYCECVSTKVITDQASLVRLNEASLKVARQEAGAQDAMAQLVGPAVMSCAANVAK